MEQKTWLYVVASIVEGSVTFWYTEIEAECDWDVYRDGYRVFEASADAILVSGFQNDLVVPMKGKAADEDTGYVRELLPSEELK